MRKFLIYTSILALAGCSPVAGLLGLDEDDDESEVVEQRMETNLLIEGTHEAETYSDTGEHAISWTIRITNSGDDVIEGQALGGCHLMFRLYDPSMAAAGPVFELPGNGVCLSMTENYAFPPGQTRVYSILWGGDNLWHEGSPFVEGRYRVTVALDLENPDAESPEFDLGEVELRR